jgi:hypothetical protein
LQSNNRLICRGAIVVGKSRNFIIFPPNESIIAWGFSGPASLDQRSLQFQQRSQIDARHTRCHLRTCDRIEHPTRDADDDARWPLNQHKLAGCSLLYPPNNDLMSEKPMPRIMDFQLLPDMGRMNG